MTTLNGRAPDAEAALEALRAWAITHGKERDVGLHPITSPGEADASKRGLLTPFGAGADRWCAHLGTMEFQAPSAGAAVAKLLTHAGSPVPT